MNRRNVLQATAALAASTLLPAFGEVQHVEEDEYLDPERCPFCDAGRFTFSEGGIHFDCYLHPDDCDAPKLTCENDIQTCTRCGWINEIEHTANGGICKAALDCPRCITERARTRA